MRFLPSTANVRVLAALGSGCFAYSLSQTMLVPSLLHIQHALHASAVGAASLLSVFLASGAVTLGIFGRLGDMYGKKRGILVQLTLFAIGSVLCALAPSLPLLLVGRALMGCSVGIFALSYAIIGELLPPEKVVGGVAAIASTLSIGAVLGQAIGGVVTDGLGFRWIFWIAVVSAVPSLLLVAFFVPESRERSRGRIDFGGAALFAAGLGLPLFAIGEAPAWGWLAWRTLGLIAAGIVALALFAVYERRRQDPLIDLPTLSLPRVRTTNMSTFFVGFGMFGVGLLLAQFVQIPRSTGYGLGASATQAGLFLIPGMVASLLVAPVAARMSNRLGPKRTLVIGTALGALAMIGVTLRHESLLVLDVWVVILFAGVGIAFAAMPALILQAVPREHSAQSTSINLIMRNTGTSIGIQLAATIVTASAAGAAFPTDAGYTLAFMLLAGGAIAALLLALAIPAGARLVRSAVRVTDEAAVVSEAISP
jgi:MFS family permease